MKAAPLSNAELSKVRQKAFKALLRGALPNIPNKGQINRDISDGLRLAGPLGMRRKQDRQFEEAFAEALGE